MLDNLSKYASNPEVKKILEELMSKQNPVESNLNVICTTGLKTLFLIAAERDDYETDPVFLKTKESLSISMDAWLEEGGELLVCDSISVFRYNLSLNIYHLDEIQNARALAIYESVLEDAGIEALEKVRYEHQKSILETLTKSLGGPMPASPAINSDNSDEETSEEDSDDLF
jgi:hypothetical protein